MLDYIWMGMIFISILYALITGRIPDLSTAIMESSKEAVTLCITLAGIIALWSGMMKIAEKSGLLDMLANRMRPLLRFLFPDIPDQHPAQKHIAANLIANAFGLGSAATAPGLEAMKSLQTLNPDPNKASDMMCAFLVINLSSLQLIPVNMLAYRMQYGSADPAGIVLPTILTTLISTCVAILYIRFRLWRRKMR